MKIWTVPVCHLNIRKKEINVIHGNQLKQKQLYLFRIIEELRRMKEYRRGNQKWTI
jgi:hypothetical protein